MPAEKVHVEILPRPACKKICRFGELPAGPRAVKTININSSSICLSAMAGDLRFCLAIAYCDSRQVILAVTRNASDKSVPTAALSGLTI